MSLPSTIDFSLIKPKGYSAYIVNRYFYPAPFNANIQQSDIIRFVISQYKGFWDPYSAYIQAEIDFSDMSNVGVLYLDGSAYSLISRSQIYVNGYSIELIDEYDTLMHFLYDMYHGEANKKTKLSEGVGSDIGGRNQESNMIINSTSSSTAFAVAGTNCYVGAAANQWIMNTDIPIVANATVAIANTFSASNSAKRMAALFEPATWVAFLATNLPLSEVPVDRYEVQLCKNNFTFSPQNVLTYPKRLTGDGKWNGFSVGNWSNHCHEYFFTKNYKRYHVKNGNVGALSTLPFGVFYFPFASSILGVLLPTESYKYLPFSMLTDLVIEFGLNKFAFFTSGFVDEVNNAVPTALGHYSFGKAPVIQYKRQWSVKSFTLNVDVILFDDESIETMVNQYLIYNGILLHTCGWTLCLKYVLETTAACAGNFYINYGFESLKALFVIYESLDYYYATYLRKHFRCSRNVTSLYVRIGEKIYPQTPITGHGGNAVRYSDNKTNFSFVNELYRAFNMYFVTNSECAINAANFAPNKRPWAVQGFTAGNLPIPYPFFTNVNYYTDSETNHLTMGYTLMFENQMRGMAVYCISFDVLGMDQNVMGGVDTKNNIPFNILVETDPTDTGSFWVGNVNAAFPDQMAETAVMAYFWAYYDVLIRFYTGEKPLKIGAQ